MDSSDLGKRIKDLRLRHNMTQKELADLIGISCASLCAFEKGSKTPSMETFISIANCLHCKSDDLLGDYINMKDESYYYRSVVNSLENLLKGDIKKTAEILNKR
ncbi:MAG: helix-turn-helix transcriptional regulator [Eubacterium sp.]